MYYTNLNFTINTGLNFQPNDFIQLSHDADNYIVGRVVSYNNTTGALLITPITFQGSGTYSTWTASLTGAAGTNGISNSSSAPPSSAAPHYYDLH